jgi:anti-sigma B factor antagonist
MAVSLEVTEHAGIPVVAVSGDVDWLSCPELESRVMEAARSGGDCVIVDLTKVDYIESSPLGTLIKTHVMLDRAGGDLALVCGPSHVARVIKQFGIDHLLPVFGDRSSASAALLPLRAHLH